VADVEGWLKGFIKTDFCLARANCSSGFPGERLHGHPYRLDSAKRATKFYGKGTGTRTEDSGSFLRNWYCS
jgi:hypothetical protein